MFRFRISWRAIIAGVVTTFAVSIIMAVLGVALGFSVIHPMASEPFSGLGTAFGIWSVLSVIVSLAAGGFMAGFVGPGRGTEHGFLTWATVLLLAGYIGGQAVGSAVDTVGSAVHGVGSAAADVASGVGSGVATLAGNAVDSIQENLAEMDVNADNMRGEVAQTLRDTGIETLQPEYLRAQLRDARADLRTAIHQISLNAANLDEAVDEFLGRQQNRVAAITGDIDRDAAVTAVMNTRNVPRGEAEQMVDNAVGVYSGVSARVGEALEDARRQVGETRTYISQAVLEARACADQLASTAARSALVAGLSLIAGAILASLAGWYGRMRSLRYFGDEIVETTTVATGILSEI